MRIGWPSLYDNYACVPARHMHVLMNIYSGIVASTNEC